MKNLLIRLYREESGATAVEYAIIAALVGVASIFAINQFGESVQGLFDEAAREIQDR